MHIYEKQASFTGAEQRAGVAILAFVVHGLFGLGPRRRKERQPADASHRPAKRSRGPPLGNGGGAERTENTSSDESLFNAAQEDDDEPLPTNFSFDWEAYRARFADTPIQDAVTAMFAEYAVLYGRIAGWITSTTPTPMTLSEAKDISQHAEDFVLNFVTPILGVVQTPKIHKLLRHVFDAINLHGNLQNGNTGGNEAVHKLDKPFYRRTNKTLADFTQQLVRQAQGSRAVLRRNAAKDAAAATSLGGTANGCAVPGREPASAAATSGPRGRDADVGRSASAGPAVAAPARTAVLSGPAARESAPGLAGHAPGGVDASRRARDAIAGGPFGSGRVPGGTHDDIGQRQSLARPRLQRRVFRARMTVNVLSRRPGLSALPSLLGRSPTDNVQVVNSVYIAAQLDCGARMRQLVRAASSFRHKPWYDAVLYDGDRDDEMLVGEVRAIIRERTQDLAVICNWEPAASPDGCPLSARSCTRLMWAKPATTEAGDWCLRVVPVRSIRRVVHVVPDFSALVRTRGVEASPPGHRADVAELRSMRYFLNDFFPWG